MPRRLLRVSVVAVTAAFAVASCGGSSSTHDALLRYLDSVNATEKRLADPLQAVTRANQAFAKKGSASPSVERQLARTVRTMRTLRRRIGALSPPPEGARMQRLLRRLADREVALAQEVKQLSVFVPRYEAALRPLAAADAALKRELGKSAKGAAAARALDAEKAAALDAYGASVVAALARLRALDPPPVWRSSERTQIATLLQLRASGAALADAIRRKRARAIPALLRRFDRAAVAGQSVAAQRRRIAAVKAYNGRIRSLSTLARAIERERGRLQRVYG